MNQNNQLIYNNSNFNDTQKFSRGLGHIGLSSQRKNNFGVMKVMTQPI